MTKQDIIERAKRVSFSSNPKDYIDFVGELAKENETVPEDVQEDKALPKVIYCGWNGLGNLSYSNTKALPNMRPYVPATNPVDATRLLPCDADEAAYQYSKTNRRICSNEVCEKVVICGNLADAFKAGIAWERERMMKEAVSMDITDDTQWEDADRFVHKNCGWSKKLETILKQHYGL